MRASLLLSRLCPSQSSSPRFQTLLVCGSGFEQGETLTAAGNSSHPNVFSYNLLKNLGAIQGSYPIIRVGGNTQ